MHPCLLSSISYTSIVILHWHIHVHARIYCVQNVCRPSLSCIQVADNPHDCSPIMQFQYVVSVDNSSVPNLLCVYKHNTMDWELK